MWIHPRAESLRSHLPGYSSNCESKKAAHLTLQPFVWGNKKKQNRLFVATFCHFWMRVGVWRQTLSGCRHWELRCFCLFTDTEQWKHGDGFVEKVAHLLYLKTQETNAKDSDSPMRTTVSTAVLKGACTTTSSTTSQNKWDIATSRQLTRYGHSLNF